MPLTEKGEKIKGAMEHQYGEKRGKEVFYASRNKGTITGVDNMPVAPSRLQLDELMIKVDAVVHRFDTFLKRRSERRRKLDAFEEAKHPRNAGGVFVTGEGEEGKEDSAKRDAEYRGAPVVNRGESPHAPGARHPDFKQDGQLDPGNLSKRDPL